ncbi:hypothetical protein L218DRAFT_946213 [Marasmius fiardii PR-910]|nr:hypothetical protein L218DRAFT_946213 [Marasmius fiardii PR-910]
MRSASCCAIATSAYIVRRLVEVDRSVALSKLLEVRCITHIRHITESRTGGREALFFGHSYIPSLKTSLAGMLKINLSWLTLKQEGLPATGGSFSRVLGTSESSTLLPPTFPYWRRKEPRLVPREKVYGRRRAEKHEDTEAIQLANEFGKGNQNDGYSRRSPRHLCDTF